MKSNISETAHHTNIKPLQLDEFCRRIKRIITIFKNRPLGMRSNISEMVHHKNIKPVEL